MTDPHDIPYGCCHCGCGRKTPVAKRNRSEFGHVKGEPTSYIRGHCAKTIPVINGKKQCSQCQRTLPVSKFDTLMKRAGPTPHSFCRECTVAEKERRRRAAGIPKFVPSQGRKHVPPEINRRRVKEWREANPEKCRAASRRRIQRERGAPFTALGREYAEDVLPGDPCSYCGERAGTIDHIDAILKGGDGDWTNLTAACLACNSGKCAKPLLGYLLYRREAAAR